MRPNVFPPPVLTISDECHSQAFFVDNSSLLLRAHLVLEYLLHIIIYTRYRCVHLLRCPFYAYHNNVTDYTLFPIWCFIFYLRTKALRTHDKNLVTCTPANPVLADMTVSGEVGPTDVSTGDFKYKRWFTNCTYENQIAILFCIMWYRRGIDSDNYLRHLQASSTSDQFVRGGEYKF